MSLNTTSVVKFLFLFIVKKLVNKIFETDVTEWHYSYIPDFNID